MTPNETPRRSSFEKFEIALGAVIFGAVTIYTYWRHRYGVSVADESFCVLLAYFPSLGAKWFVNDSTLQQPAAMLASPLVRAAAAVFGRDGLILTVRRLHLLFALLAALQSYRVFRFWVPRGLALALASVVVAFIPSGIASLNYNTQGSLFFGLATLFGVEAFLKKKRSAAAFSGFFWVLAVFSYPPLMAAFVVFAGAAAVKCVKERVRFRGFAAPFSMAVFAPSAILIGLLAWCGFENIMTAYQYAKNISGNGPLPKLLFIARLAGSYLPPAPITLALLGGWIAIGFFKPRISAFLLLAFIGAFFMMVGNHETPPIQVLWALFPFFFFGLALQSKFETQDRHLIWLLIVPAIFGAVSIGLSSRVTLYSMCLTMVFGGLATALLIVGKNRLAAWPLAAMLLGGSIWAQQSAVYEDAPIDHLQYEMTSGPYKGLFTTATKAQWIDETLAAIKSTDGFGKTLILKDTFPIGYLYTDKKPFGPIPYFGPALFYGDLRGLYLERFQNKDFWPDVVIDLKYYPMMPNSIWPMLDPSVEPHDPFYKFFQKTGHYRVIDKPTAEVLIRKGL